MTAPKYYTDNGFLNQLMDVYNEPQEENNMTASTYPEKLVNNLRAEIEDLKKERDNWKNSCDHLQGRVDYYIRQQERLRYPRDAIDI